MLCPRFRLLYLRFPPKERDAGGQVSLAIDLAGDIVVKLPATRRCTIGAAEQIDRLWRGPTTVLFRQIVEGAARAWPWNVLSWWRLRRKLRIMGLELDGWAAIRDNGISRFVKELQEHDTNPFLSCNGTFREGLTPIQVTFLRVRTEDSAGNCLIESRIDWKQNMSQRAATEAVSVGEVALHMAAVELSLRLKRECLEFVARLIRLALLAI